jgi:hypothetical protein
LNRVLVLVAVAAGFLAAACGSGATAANSTTSPSPNAGAQFRNGASGQLVQINGQSLILTGPNGDLTVNVSSSTTYSRTSTAVLADIVPGQCLVATGQKDASGGLVAMTVRLSPKTASGCAAPTNGGGPGAAPGASPRPIPSGQPTQAFVTGEVTAAAGVSVTVLTAGTGSQTITVPTTAAVTRMLSASAADLQTGQCVRANGTKDSSGTVEATSIAITPAGPSGTCTTGFGGRGPGRAGASPGAPAPNN